MLVVGQPKNTAEYIQASSRVGRDRDRPGLVVTLGNWARPRDLAHFEQFRHYHETFYAQVEALSVTPFSVTSLERGLDGVLVSAARVLQAVVPDGLSPERNAGRIEEQRDFVVEPDRRARQADTARVGRGRRRPGAAAAAQPARPLGRPPQAPRRPAQDAGLRAGHRRHPLRRADDERGERPVTGPAARTPRRSWSPTPCARCSRRSTSWSAPSRTT